MAPSTTLIVHFSKLREMVRAKDTFDSASPPVDIPKSVPALSAGVGSVIDVEFSLRWVKPVYVGENDELDTTIEGPADAIRWMNNHFISKSGFVYWRAHTVCVHAVLRQLHADLARQPFLDAWLEESRF